MRRAAVERLRYASAQVAACGRFFFWGGEMLPGAIAPGTGQGRAS